MKRVHDSQVNPAGLIPTLQGLGIQGIVPIGALAWQTYPVAAQAPFAAPSLAPGVNGAPIGLIAPNLLTLPYLATHLNCSVNTSSGFDEEGNRIMRWTIQDSLGVTRRQVYYQNPAKLTGIVRFGESKVFALPPIPLPPSLGVRAMVSSDNPAVGYGARAYLTALLVQPKIVPTLLAVAPTALGAVLPTTAAGTALTASATPWAFGSYVQMSAGLTPGVLVTAVVISSASTDSGQVALATGAGGSEVDWGVFGWAEPFGVSRVGVRYDLRPYPLYIPPSTRIAARARSTEASGSFSVGLEYIPLPIR